MKTNKLHPHFVVMNIYKFGGWTWLITHALARTNHYSQGLTLDKLVFDPTNIKKHGLTYTTSSHIQTK
jgi:hypothetical protein